MDISARRPATTAVQVAGRLAIMAALVAVFVVVSTPLRSLQPLQLRITTNIVFFVLLGIADQLILAPILDRFALGRAAALVLETLAFGWFFSPGGDKPASKILFFVHLLPFFAAVFGGALLVMIIQWWRGRAAR